MREFPPFRLDTVNQCLWRGDAEAGERILLVPTLVRVVGEGARAGRGAARPPELVVRLPVVADSETVFLDEIRDVRLDPGDATRLPPEPGSPTRGSYGSQARRCADHRGEGSRPGRPVLNDRYGPARAGPSGRPRAPPPHRPAAWRPVRAALVVPLADVALSANGNAEPLSRHELQHVHRRDGREPDGEDRGDRGAVLRRALDGGDSVPAPGLPARTVRAGGLRPARRVPGAGHRAVAQEPGCGSP